MRQKDGKYKNAVEVLSMPDVELSEIITIIRGIGKERDDPALAGFEVPTYPLIVVIQYKTLSIHPSNTLFQYILSIYPHSTSSHNYLIMPCCLYE